MKFEDCQQAEKLHRDCSDHADHKCDFTCNVVLELHTFHLSPIIQILSWKHSEWKSMAYHFEYAHHSCTIINCIRNKIFIR